MEEKLKRECKSYLEKLFKKNDELGSGSVTMPGMRKILIEMIPDYNDSHDAELNELMKGMARATKYTQLNKATNQFDVKYLENSIDFPSALYLCVYFLKKIEVKSVDCFSGRNDVKFGDLAGQNFNPIERSALETEAHRRRYF